MNRKLKRLKRICERQNNRVVQKYYHEQLCKEKDLDPKWHKTYVWNIRWKRTRPGYGKVRSFTYQIYRILWKFELAIPEITKHEIMFSQIELIAKDITDQMITLKDNALMEAILGQPQSLDSGPRYVDKGHS
jgi:hypothetical protein